MTTGKQIVKVALLTSAMIAVVATSPAAESQSTLPLAAALNPPPLAPPVQAALPIADLVEDPPGETMVLAYISAEEYGYGHWIGRAAWHKVLNDEDPDNRYYATIVKWFGKGSSTGDEYFHCTTDAYHLARGVAADGNTFLYNFAPLDHEQGSGSWTFTIGWPPSASYTWTQERAAVHRYDLWDFASGTWDDQEYGNRAFFDNQLTNPPSCGLKYRNSLEYAAAGIIPTGHHGYMYLAVSHHSFADCDFWGNCDNYVDDTGWRYRTVTWA